MALLGESKRLLRHSAVYSIGSVLNSLVGFVMIPVYTRFLTPEDYGILELLALLISMCGIIIGAGVGSAMYRFYFEFESQKERNEVVSTALLTFSSLSFILLLPLLANTRALAHLVLGSNIYASFLFIGTASLFLNSLVEIGSNYLRIREKSAFVMIFSVFKLAAALSLNILFVVYLRKGVWGILTSTLIASALGAVILISWTLRQVGLQFSFRKCGDMLKYGLPLVPTALAARLVHASDRYFIRQFSGLHDTGIYGLGYRLGAMVNVLITSPFMQIWQVRRFSLYKEPNSQVLFGKVFTYFVFIVVFAGVAMSVLARDLLRVMATERFLEAYKVVPLIVLSYVIFSFHYHLNIGILIEKKTKYLAYINCANGVLNLILNFLLISRYGMWGAAIATLLCFTFKVSATYMVNNRFYSICLEKDRIFKIFLVAFVIYFFASLLNLESLILSVLAKTLIILSYPTFLYFLGFYTNEEIEGIRGILREKKGALRGVSQVGI